ncbi:hypothetical protein ACHAXH_002097 [Discostella pseudostelligera]
MVTEPTSSTTTPRRKRRWGDAATVEEGVNVIATPTATATAAAAGAIVNAVEDVDENGNGNALPPRSATANNNITVVSATNPPPPPATTTAGGDAMARAAALQASIRERLAALKARTAGTSTAATATTVAAAAPGGGTITIPAPLPSSIAPTLSSKATMTTTTTTNASTTNNNNDDNNETSQHKSKKAKIFELDMSTTAPTRLLERKQRREERLLRATAEDDNNNNNQPTEKINPYLAHIVPSAALSNEGGKKMMKKKDAHTKMKKSLQQPQNLQQQRTEEEELLLLDTRLSAPQKSRPKSRPIHFVEPGTYVALGEKKRSIAMKAEESGYISGRKVGNVVKSVGMGGVAVAVVGGGGSDEAAEEEGGATTNYYGSSESGKIGIIEQRLPPRPDAPEIELEDYTTKKRILTSVSDVNVEQNEDAILAAIHDAILSGMPHAVEWWDAELLPSKLRKELAEEEGKSIVSRARKQQQVVKTDATTTSTTTTTTTTPVGDAMVDDDANTSAAVAQFHSQTQRQDELIAKCYKYASISHSKTHTLIQHPVPILTPAQLAAKEAMKNKPPTLHLTKAERKRHRKLRRAERLREQQDLQAAGLIPPPEPRLTLSNYMKVLGDQAVIDPSKMEAVVMNQIQGRKLKHDQMNAERKLSKEQKAAKHAKKLQEDTTQSVHVALFYVKDMSHPYHRTKVDLNAQQNSITGGVLECASIGYGGDDSGNDGSHSMALVVAEGGEKAVKRYVRLMTMRMRWKGEDFYEDDDDDDNDKDHEELMVGDDDNEDGGDGVEGGANTEKKEQRRKKFNPNNECELIWSGLVMKRAFHTFMFQSAESAIVARKILEAKGVAHYWDLAMGHVEGKTS